ncbi:hypothetical protein HID58_003804 [Brassica napus]
MISPV